MDYFHQKALHARLVLTSIILAGVLSANAQDMPPVQQPMPLVSPPDMNMPDMSGAPQAMPPGMMAPPGMQPPGMQPAMQRDEPSQNNLANQAPGSFRPTDPKKLRLMRRVSGPECTFEQWRAGKWYKGSHEHTFGWWWIANETWYSFEKRKSAIPEYEQRSVIVYVDEIKKADMAGPAPASVHSGK